MTAHLRGSGEGLPITGPTIRRQRLLENSEVLLRQVYIRRLGILRHPVRPPTARDGDDVWTLCEQPREGELTGREATQRGNLREGLNLRLVLHELSAVEPRVAPAEVAHVDVVPAQCPGQQTSAQGAVGDEPHT